MMKGAMTIKTTNKPRLKAWRRGRWGEWLARWLLRLKGYRILAATYRSPVGEIDIVARRGDVLAVIEVKARSNLALAGDAVQPRQRARLVRASTAFLAHNPDLNGLTVRFDVILVTPWAWPCHIEDAWRA